MLVDTNKVRIGRHICVRLADDEYVFWSNQVDAPITFIMNGEEALELMIEAEKMDWPSNKANTRWKRLQEFGTTEMSCRRAEDTYLGNHAGPSGIGLTLQGLRRAYAGNSDRRTINNFKPQEGDVEIREED